MPIIVALVLHRRRRERQAIRDFAALLDGGTVKARRAHARWKGMEVSIRWAGRPHEYVFLTVVTAARPRVTPLAALFRPRREEQPPRLAPPDAAPWLRDLDRAYEIYGAPSELVPIVLDEGLGAAFREMQNTEVEIMPHLVNVQLREVVLEAELVRPLLDFAVRCRKRFGMQTLGSAPVGLVMQEPDPGLKRTLVPADTMLIGFPESLGGPTNSFRLWTRTCPRPFRDCVLVTVHRFSVSGGADQAVSADLPVMAEAPDHKRLAISTREGSS
jgi:hypothetical protein